MLAASLCRDAADYLAYGRKDNRENAIARLGLGNKSRDEQDRALDVDPEYQKQKILRGMLTLFVEFVGFIMFKSLEERFHENVGKLLTVGSLSEVAKKLDFEPMVTRHRKRTFKKDDLLVVLYSTFEHCVGQLYESNWLRGYNDAPVKNKYIYSIKNTDVNFLKNLSNWIDVSRAPNGYEIGLMALTMPRAYSPMSNASSWATHRVSPSLATYSRAASAI